MRSHTPVPLVHGTTPKACANALSHLKIGRPAASVAQPQAGLLCCWSPLALITLSELRVLGSAVIEAPQAQQGVGTSGE